MRLPTRRLGSGLRNGAHRASQNVTVHGDQLSECRTTNKEPHNPIRDTLGINRGIAASGPNSLRKNEQRRDISVESSPKCRTDTKTDTQPWA